MKITHTVDAVAVAVINAAVAAVAVIVDVVAVVAGMFALRTGCNIVELRDDR